MKKFVLSMFLIVSLLLCACHAESDISSDGSSAALPIESSEHMTSVDVTSALEHSEPTESELMEAHLQRVLAMLDECRPEEAYQFPDFSGEITDVRITVRERNVDMYLWMGETDEKVYDVFYGYLSDGVWYDFPSGNYELRDLWSVETREWYQDAIEPNDSWETCTSNHVVEIGPYVLCAFSVGGEGATDLLSKVHVNDTLNSPVQEFSEYCNFQSGSFGEPINWHYKENMHAYGTDDYDIYMEPLLQWYFIVLEKEQLTEEYAIVVTQDWEEERNDAQDTYTYDEIMAALNRQ